jgi:hypothetical protein
MVSQQTKANPFHIIKNYVNPKKSSQSNSFLIHYKGSNFIKRKFQKNLWD